MKKKKMLLIVILISCAITVDLTIFVWHPWTMGLPLYGWEYDEELTQTYWNDTFGETPPPTAYTYRVYVESDGCLSCSRQIRLYMRVMPNAWWTLENEGYVDSEGNMYWMDLR